MRMRYLAMTGVFLILCLTSQAFAIEFDEIGGVEVHGFLSQGFIQSQDNNFFSDSADDGTFQFNEFGITFSTDLSEKLHMGIQILAYDLGDLGNDKVGIDWAFADYRWKDWMGFRIGKTKFTTGLYNEIKDIDLLTPSIFMPLSVYNQTWREGMSAIKGVNIYGTIPAGPVGDISYNLAYGRNDLSTDGGESRLLEDQVPEALGLEIDSMDTDYLWSGQVMWNTFLTGLRVGASYWELNFDADTTTAIDSYSQSELDVLGAALGYDLVAVDHVFEVEMDNMTLSTEFVFNNLTIAAELSEITYNLNLTGISKIDEFTSQGYYGNIAYRFTDWFQLSVYYSEYYGDKDDKDGKRYIDDDEEPDHRGWSKDFCLTTRFDISYNWIVKLEGHMINGTDILLGADAEVDDEGNRIFEEDWFVGVGKVTYTF